MGLVAHAVIFSGKDTTKKSVRRKSPSALPCHPKIYLKKEKNIQIYYTKKCAQNIHTKFDCLFCHLLLFPSEDSFSFEKIINIAVPDSFQLQRRVYKGIPDRLRGEVWSRLLNLTKVKNEQEGVYMVSRFASVKTSTMH